MNKYISKNYSIQFNISNRKIFFTMLIFVCWTPLAFNEYICDNREGMLVKLFHVPPLSILRTGKAIYVYDATNKFTVSKSIHSSPHCHLDVWKGIQVKSIILWLAWHKNTYFGSERDKLAMTLLFPVYYYIDEFCVTYVKYYTFN